MKNFNEFWKNKANNKQIEVEDMVSLCILKTIKAKSENKKEVLTYYLGKAFSPGKICQHRSHPFLALHNATIGVRYRMKIRSQIMGQPITNFLETNEEIELFAQLLEVAKDYGRM